MQSFFQDIVHACTSVSFYNPATFRKSFFRGLLVLYVLSICGVLVAIGRLFWHTSNTQEHNVSVLTHIDKLPQYYDRYATHIKKSFPRELVLHYANGILTKNIPGPVHIPFPTNVYDSSKNSASSPYLVTVDTDGRVEDYPRAKSIFFVTDRAIVLPQSDTSGTRIFLFSEIDTRPNQRLSMRFGYPQLLAIDTAIAKQIPKLQRIIRVALVVIPLALALIVPFALTAITLIQLLFGTLLLYFIGKFFHVVAPFGLLYRQSMYLIIPNIICAWFLPVFTGWYGLVFFLVFGTYMVVQSHKQTATSTDTTIS